MYKEKEKERGEIKKMYPRTNTCSRCHDNHNTPPRMESDYLMPKNPQNRVNFLVLSALVNISVMLL